LSVLTGDSAAIGAEMTSHRAVRKLSFTGSTAVGKKLMAQCVGTLKETLPRARRQRAVHRI